MDEVLHTSSNASSSRFGSVDVDRAQDKFAFVIDIVMIWVARPQAHTRICKRVRYRVPSRIGPV